MSTLRTAIMGFAVAAGVFFAVAPDADARDRRDRRDYRRHSYSRHHHHKYYRHHHRGYRYSRRPVVIYNSYGYRPYYYDYGYRPYYYRPYRPGFSITFGGRHWR